MPWPAFLFICGHTILAGTIASIIMTVYILISAKCRNVPLFFVPLLSSVSHRPQSASLDCERFCSRPPWVCALEWRGEDAEEEVSEVTSVLMRRPEASSSREWREDSLGLFGTPYGLLTSTTTQAGNCVSGRLGAVYKSSFTLTPCHLIMSGAPAPSQMSASVLWSSSFDDRDTALPQTSRTKRS